MKIFKTKAGTQSILLFASQIIFVAIGFGIKSIQTNYLGPEVYGLYAFFASFTGFTLLFFRFGFYSSLQVLLAENKDIHKQAQWFGVGFTVNFFIGLLYSLFIWFCSFYIDTWFNTDIGYYLRIFAPLAMILPTRSMISAMSIGSNRVHILPIYDNMSKLFFLLALVLLAWKDALNLYLVILFNLATLFVALGMVYRQFQPSFKNLTPLFGELWHKTKSFGFHFYIGSTANQSTFKLDEMTITYFLGTTINGFYTLANVIASPMIMGSQALSNSLFKRFAHQNKIDSKVFLYNTLWLIVSFIGLYFLAEWAVELFFGEEFNQTSTYAIGIGIAFFFQGLYQPFNFLSAKSEGKAVRNVAITEASINLIGNLALIPFYGVAGAIFTSIFAKFIHFIGKLYYYRLYLKNNG